MADVNSTNTGEQMREILLLVFCCFLLSCTNTTGVSQPGREPSKPLNEQEEAYISQVEADGRLMYEKDIRAANATDLLLNKVDPSDYPNFVGWVTYPNEDDFTVSFYERNEETFTIIADVIYSADKGSVLDFSPPRQPSNTEISMIKARIAALEKGINSCADRFNTIVIPSQNSDEWDVYVLAATTNPKLVQVGGHVKVSVSKHSSNVTATMPLSKSCLALDKSGEGLPEGATISALTVSHIVSPMPVAIHPYLNLLHNISLAVASERGLWMVSSGNVELM